VVAWLISFSLLHAKRVSSFIDQTSIPPHSLPLQPALSWCSLSISLLSTTVRFRFLFLYSLVPSALISERLDPATTPSSIVTFRQESQQVRP
jgi:hypothetical protein